MRSKNLKKFKNFRFLYTKTLHIYKRHINIIKIHCIFYEQKYLQYPYYFNNLILCNQDSKHFFGL